MAEVIVGVAGIASIAGLADVCCRLAGKLYKSSQAVKSAPQNVQTLVKRLESLREQLTEIDGLLKRYPTSAYVTEDAFCTSSMESLWQACNAELTEVENSTTRFTTMQVRVCRIQDVRRRINWAMDESKINKHCDALQELSARITTALSTAGRENDDALQARVGDLRSDVQAFAAGTEVQISTESEIIQTRLDQAVDKLARGQESIHTNLRVTQDSICGVISQSRDTSLQAIGTIRADIRRTSRSNRRNQQRMNRQLRKLNQGRSQLTSMLTQLSSLHLESQRADSPDVAQFSGLDNMAFLLIQMREHLNQLIADLQSNPLLRVSNGEVDFFQQEFEPLVTFCSESGAFRGNRRLGLFNSTTHSTYDSLAIESRPLPKTMERKHWQRKSHKSPLGRLEVQFEEIVGDFDDLPTTVQRASFHFVPSGDTFSIGVYASFRRDLRMAHRPCIFRSLHEIRIVPEEVREQVVDALCADDLPALKRMLSFGQITPWDRFIHPGDAYVGYLNLIETAIRYQPPSQAKPLAQSEIIQYLLKGAWDIESSNTLQILIWGHLRISKKCNSLEQFEARYEISMRVAELGQKIDGRFFEDLCYYGVLHSGLLSDLIGCRTLRKYFQFFVSHGMDLEYADSIFDETPLLHMARTDTKLSAMWLRVILEHGVNLTATNYVGNGPLHLLFQRRKHSCWERNGSKTRLLYRKLVLLLRAGCSVDAVDLLRKTPGDLARDKGYGHLWTRALQAVGRSSEDKIEKASLDLAKDIELKNIGMKDFQARIINDERSDLVRDTGYGHLSTRALEGVVGRLSEDKVEKASLDLAGGKELGNIRMEGFQARIVDDERSDLIQISIQDDVKISDQGNGTNAPYPALDILPIDTVSSKSFKGYHNQQAAAILASGQHQIWM